MGPTKTGEVGGFWGLQIRVMVNPKKKNQRFVQSLWKINKNRGEIWKRFKVCVQD